VTVETAPAIARAGGNVLVAGSAIFKGGSVEAYRQAIADLRHAAEGARA
jgi:ribulose-phosphate 3-epimerase